MNETSLYMYRIYMYHFNMFKNKCIISGQVYKQQTKGIIFVIYPKINLRDGKNDKKIKKKPFPGHVVWTDVVLWPPVPLELQPHVSHVQDIGHAAGHGDGDGEPPVYEHTQPWVAYW